MGGENTAILLCRVFFTILAMMLYVGREKPVGKVPPLWGMALFSALLIVQRLAFLSFLPDMLTTVLLCAAYLLLVTGKSAATALYAGSVFYLLIDFANALSRSLIMGIVVPALGIGGSAMAVVLNLGVFVAAIVGLSFAVRRLVFFSDSLRLRHCLSLLLPLIPFAYIRMGSYLYDSSNVALFRYNVVLLLCIMAPTLLMLLSNKFFLSAEAEKAKRLEMESMLRKQHEQYIVRSASIEQLNKRYHDLKHYLTALPQLARSDDIEAQVSMISREIGDFELYRCTGNAVVDVILAEKLKYCSEKGIRLTAYISVPELDFMDSLDICTLFGNSLDNAIEAVSTLPGELCEIHAKATRRGGMLCYTVSNYYDEISTDRTGRLLSTKGKGHGLGLENIRTAVEKYGGSVATDIGEKRFTLNVLIPIPGTV